MIEVKFSGENQKTFLMKGHAEYSEHGTDIVCAAASSIAITSLKAMAKFLNCTDYKLVEKEGYLHLTLFKNDEVVNQLYNNLRETLLELETQYPDYIKIRK